MTLAKMQDRPDPEKNLLWLKVHGGLGDTIWLCKKFVNFPTELHISISNENRSRPRRSAPLVEHLPRVISYNYDLTAFCEDGNDWPDPRHPACAIGEKFFDMGLPLNTPIRLECNRHLEGGRRIEDWLPDIPTTHHFKFKPCGPPTFEIKNPCVVLHLAGWHDVPDNVWIAAADLFRNLCHVYIVGGSYDGRPRRVYEAVKRRMQGVTLVEDTAWENIIGLLSTCLYCFGHASGFTAVADVLKVKGAVFNPRSVPGLIGTWNSPENPDFIQVDEIRDFEAAIHSAYRLVATGNQSTWPLNSPRGPRLEGRTDKRDEDPEVNAARSVGALSPRNVMIWSAPGTENTKVPAALLSSSYDFGRPVHRLQMIGYGADALAEVYKMSMRSTRRPIVDVAAYWEGEYDEWFDVIVLTVSDRPAEAAGQVRQAWTVLSPQGTVLVGGPAAAAAIESLGATLKVKPTEVAGVPGWHYLHRRM